MIIHPLMKQCMVVARPLQHYLALLLPVLLLAQGMHCNRLDHLAIGHALFAALVSSYDAWFYQLILATLSHAVLLFYPNLYMFGILPTCIEKKHYTKHSFWLDQSSLIRSI